MQLTRLEIKGFKSFGEKAVIHFDKGITGIVGPNGCGKSNVVDAMRWVLGEQRTKNLRSDKMENIIFNGTKHRKPLQMAEVSLTFDNNKNLLPTEYSQVTIARRYYRTGDSEYLLNNVVCRLKDIHNLLMDKGIGSDNYAIIELKMVDEILNDTHNSRRGLFEEAAGISKFKAQKKETFKKLKDTDQDLSRIEDLLFEIEKNLKSLERQAKQAQKYDQTKTEYKKISLDYARKSVSQKVKKFTSLQEKIQFESKEKENLSTQIQAKNHEVEQQKINIQKTETLLFSRQKTLNQQTAKIKEFENEQKLKAERQGFLHEKKQTLELQLAHEKNIIESSESELESLEIQLNSVQKILSQAFQNFDSEKKNLEKQKAISAEVRQQYHTIQERLKIQEKEAQHLKKTMESAQIQHNNARQESERIFTESESQQSHLQEFSGKLEDLRINLETKEFEAEELQVKEKRLQENIINTKTKIKQFKELRINLNRSLDALGNEYKLLKSVIDNLEGFPEAIKFLKKNKAWNYDIPLLSDVLTCEEKYRPALENILQKYLNYYIVQTEKEALEGLQILDKNDKGKAGFFVLEDMLETEKITLPKIENTIRLTEIIEFESDYKNLIYSLLNDIFILKNFESGQDFEFLKNEKNYQTSFTFVTLDGKIIRQNSELFGGSVGSFEGKKIGRISRLKNLAFEIENIEKKIQKIDGNILQNESEIERLKSESYQAEIRETEHFVSTLKQQIVSVRSRKEQLTEIVQKQDERHQEIQEKIYEFKEILAEKSPKLAQIKTEINELREKTESLEIQLEEAEETKELASKAYHEQNILMLQKQNQAEGLNKETDYKKKNLEGSKKRIEKLTLDLQMIGNQLDNSENNIENSGEILQKLKHEREQIKAGVNETEKEFYALRGQITAAEKWISETRQKRENTEQILQNLHHQANELRIEMLSTQERLAVEFEEDLDALLENTEMAFSAFSEEDLKVKMQTLKQNLQKFGQINLAAPEAYQEIKGRYDFIDAQKQDLVNAKNSLLQTIEETDKTAQENFMNAFHQIRTNFIHVFRSLFSEEDSCDLILAEPENPLESKLDIIARPKGKKPLTINQLSGGEKTLTAISLLFAIYLLRPAPFCIFDEVDAPLDDANIDKFNRIIKKFSTDSQFIIVTHNKRTMAQTDVVYGVTMPASDYGVSRVLPVDLRDMGKHHL